MTVSEVLLLKCKTLETVNWEGVEGVNSYKFSQYGGDGEGLLLFTVVKLTFLREVFSVAGTLEPPSPSYFNKNLSNTNITLYNC